MTNWTFKTEVSLGHLLTAISIIVSVGGLLISWRKDRLLRRKEYADRIRNSAGLVIAKLERWQEILLNFYEEIQPLITDADAMLIKEQDVISVRDYFWRKVVALRADLLKRIVDEEIEIAYVALYGYDSRIHDLFSEVISQIKSADRSIYQEVLRQTQDDILSLENKDILSLRRKDIIPLENPRNDQNFYSAQIGNMLRKTCYDLSVKLDNILSNIILPFRKEIIRVIEGSDAEIVAKKNRIASPKDVFPSRKMGSSSKTRKRLEIQSPAANPFRRGLSND